jgi:hypothetical protein
MTFYKCHTATKQTNRYSERHRLKLFVMVINIVTRDRKIAQKQLTSGTV